VRTPAARFAFAAILIASSARAQESTIRDVTTQPEQTANAPSAPNAPGSPAQPSTTSTLSTLSPVSSPTTSTITDPSAPSVSGSISARPSLPMDWNDRWHRSRVVYGIGGVTGLLGTGLSLASVAVVVVTGYPCDPFDPSHSNNPKDTCNQNAAVFHASSPTDAAPMLAYLGSSLSAVGFVFSAAGLGWQHHLLAEVNADPGRGLFTAGTVLGVLGFTSVGASYFFGLTNYLNSHDQGLAILASTLTGAALCTLGGLLYLIDSSRTKKAWERLTTF